MSKAKNSKATNSRTKSYMTAYIYRCDDSQYDCIYTMLEEDFDILYDIVKYINNGQYPEHDTKNPFLECGIKYEEFEPYITGNTLGKFNLNPHHFKNFIDYPKALERCLENIDGYGDLFQLQLFKCSMERFTDYQKKEYQNKMRKICDIP